MLNRLAFTLDRISTSLGGTVAAACVCLATLSLTGVAYGILDQQIDVSPDWRTSQFVLVGLGTTTSVLLASFVALLGRAR